VVFIATLFAALAVTSDLTVPFLAWDSHAYWVALGSAHPYAGVGVGEIGSYLYPPPFLQVLRPLGLLPWPVFAFGWFLLVTAACISLLRRVPERLAWMMPLLVYIGGADVWAGNINILLAYLIVAALERPVFWTALWSVPLLTKMTPAVGVLWHLFRREWRTVVFVAVTTAGLAALSLAFGRDLWREWAERVLFGQPLGGFDQSLPIPLLVRIPTAVALVWWGARTGRPSLVPLACMLALPVIWFNGFALILGSAVLYETRVPGPARS
jgi:hypothetical protein